MTAYAVATDPSIEFGSDEYFKVLGSRLTQILNETQPEKSQINKANMFRSANPIARSLSMFGTPTNQTLNNLAQSIMQYRYELKYGTKAGQKSAMESLVKSIGGTITSAIFVALIRSLRDMLRSKDKDDEVDFKDRFTAQFITTMLAPTLVGDEIASYLMDKWEYGGVNFYDMTTTDTQFLQNVTSTIDTIYNLIFNDKLSPTKKVVDTIKAVGTVTPVDTRSLVRIVEALMKFTAPDMWKAYSLSTDTKAYEKWAKNSDTSMSEFYKGYLATRKKRLEANGKKYNNTSIKETLQNEGLQNLYDIFKL